MFKINIGSLKTLIQLQKYDLKIYNNLNRRLANIAKSQRQNEPFTCTNNTEMNTNTSMEATPINCTKISMQ